MPATVVCDLILHDLTCAEGIECFEGKGGDHCTDERLPHCLVWEVV